ncbi:patellin-4 [Manihot esculenta]|uniref:Uncharacterized protein n=1 Tax=Manihot esculenta TaxID=3983 RepID=A0ACB7GET0_MANES|nr:patellin-4 [Manihot esculenta]KAG8638198.1 hypothetical protein MANES_14G010200v8 [Manihot esculenta]
MEENTPQIPQEKEPSKTVTMETQNAKVDDDKSDSKEEDDQKPKEIAVVEEKKLADEEKNEASSSGLQKSSSFMEESNLLSDLKDHEKKALSELRSKIEEAILKNELLQEKKQQEKEASSRRDREDADQKEKSTGTDKKEDDSEKKEQPKQVEGEGEGGTTSNQEKEEETPATNTGEKEIAAKESKEDTSDKQAEKEEKTREKEGEEAKENAKQESFADQTVDKDISLWGVPLLPSKGDNRTDTVLLMLLRAREFKTSDAFEMLRSILKWRKENKIDSILEEDIEADLGSMAYMEGNDRNGHPVCFNIFAVFGNDELHGKTFEEKREKFMWGRIQLMEKGIRKLDFKPGGASAILQINDLKNTPLPTKKELRNATKKAVELLQDNYPEFVAKNIFINVPFWYYAYSALFSPTLSPRSKSKFVYARSAKVTDTLLKYIAASQIPVQYGGLKRETDSEFSVDDDAQEAIVKAGSQETIEIPAPETEQTLIWDLTVSGWEVNYKEEFVPTDEGSYTIIVQKGRRITWQDGTIRNSFTNKEPGKLVITIENGAFKKKRILYRYKTRTLSSS